MSELHELAKCGETIALARALDIDPSKLEEVDPETNDTLLSTAVNHGNKETVTMLLDRGANLSAMGDDQWTMLHKACYQGHEEVAALLISRGCSIDAKDDNGWTPLHNACADGNESMATLLLDHGSSLEEKDRDGWAPVHLVCDCADDEAHTSVLRLLAARGAVLNLQDTNGETPLHRTATKGFPLLAGVLLDLGVDIKIVDNFGWTSLHIASAQGHVQVLKVLAARGAELEKEDSNGWTALMVAAGSDQPAAVSALLELGADPNACANDFTTALYIASAKGYEKVIRALCAGGVDLEARNGQDELTALHIATSKQQTKAALLLLKKGADIEAVDKNGLTVLHRAAAKGLADIVKLLLDHGANLNGKAHFGSTPLDFAKARGHDEVAALLVRRAGAVLPPSYTDKSRSPSPPRRDRPPSPKKVLPSVTSTSRQSGTEAITAKAQEMMRRRRENKGVRASINIAAAQPVSDLEAAALACLSMDHENEAALGGREHASADRASLTSAAARAFVEQNAEDISSNSTKVRKAKQLPPELYAEVLRVAPEVMASKQVQAGGERETPQLSVKDLRRRSIAAVINFDVAHKEQYLTEAQFTQLFGMTKAQFEHLPKWKRETKKKELGLF